ncbi:non-ribosomal peptide synthetase [Actinophytocola xinjiangensis]|uniref:Non-ribosomal peptide synthetase n=1 Tax=Actinophytocola xinjiangensis TaxID=485602 RepID=A0A7Z0WLD7_9PSEU|nr:hybrid non-ribosomal peptide synthetase/type I polyketide synthase [Actinophytocola xinjiangensis]OLF10153.1 non-ribosomal peptide synthetase [Actinophytocola xinjiangensis]
MNAVEPTVEPTPTWLLGAATERELRALAGRLHTRLSGADTDPWDVARTLVEAGPARRHRAVVLGGTDRLRSLAIGEQDAGVIVGAAGDRTRPAFVFPGQGAIWPGMAVELLDTAPVFARAVGDCADAIAPHVDWSLLDVLRAEDPAHYEITDVLQPVLFAIMVGLAELWRAHGVWPHAVVGHSIGEVAAAFVSGAMSLDEAARLAVLWSRAQAALTGLGGGMAVVALPEHEVLAHFDGRGDVVVSGVMAPRSSVVSGDSDVLAEVVARLRAKGVYADVMSVPLAAHSPRVEALRADLLAALGTVATSTSTLPYYSSVTGGPVDTATLDAEYWFRNLRQPMLFERAVKALLADGYPALVELSVHPVLTMAIRQSAESAGVDAPVVNSLRRDGQSLEHFTAALAEAHVLGVDVDWHPVLGERGTVIDLPELTAPAGDEPRATPARKAVALPELVSAQVAGALGIGVELDTDAYGTSLFELGCTSLQLVKLQSGLAAELGVTLESTFIIDHPTASALVEELSRRLDPGTAGQVTLDEEPERPRAEISPAEPIAVVGMAFRLPGGVNDRDQLWAALRDQVDLVGDLPAGRWDHSDLDLSEVTTTQGGYLDGVDQFDPLFFNISPAEAESIDPQQRLLLELTWEALEDAGLAPDSAGRDRRVGVVVGVFANDYLQVGKNLGFPAERYTYTGNMANATAGRISYCYGFDGPSTAIDAACASSLYAVHQAAQDLRLGSCDLVVAAGVNLILSPEGHLSFSRLQALSPTGRCRSFDNGADGYIRSEGAAVVVLKRLSDAERDGDDVLAVISGTAINHNGQGGGFTVPSGTAQQRVVRAAMAQAGVGIDDVSYVETHGSATPIGDPQEVNALARVFQGRRAPLRIGSVKSNMGHLEAAAGMAALCKVIVSMRHGQLPATLHFREGNHLIDWANIPIEVVAERTDWAAGDGPRRAGISSFGINGSNAHIVVEEHRAIARPRPASTGPRLLPLSARSAPALRTALADLAAWGGTADLGDLAHTLGERRSALRHRAALVCETVEDIPAAVEAALAAPAPERTDGGLVFVFSGQGTQYPGMARELYDAAPAFRRELDAIDREFRRVGDVSPVEAMFGQDEEVFRSAGHTQAMIFATELALARYWRELGITPDAVLGHSIGEYAAACFASVMSLTQAVVLVTRRARAVSAQAGDGGMATLLCSPERAGELLAAHPDVAVAAVNAPENVTVAGPAASLAALGKAARKQRIFVERLDVSHAYHSPMMAGAAEQLHEQIRHQHFEVPAIRWISARTGAFVDTAEPIGARYWSEHLTEPVLFATAVETAVADRARVFVEIGATATVGGLIAQRFPDEVVVVTSLRKGRPDVRQVLDGAAELWRHGRNLNWAALPGERGNLVRDLPHTPFDRQRVWYKDGNPAPATVSRPAEPVRTVERTVEPTVDRTAQRAAVSDFVRQCLTQITGVSAEAIDESEQLFSLGIDSLMLVQLGKRLEDRYDIEIPIRAFFESLHTPGLLVDFVQENRPAEPEPAPEPVVAQPVPVPTTAPVPAMAPAAASSPLEEVIRGQLAIMEQQLKVLSAAAPAPAPEAPAPARQQRPTRRVGSHTNNIELAGDRLTDQQAAFVRDFVARYTARTPNSRDYTAEHRETLADWIASLNFNPSLKETVYPMVSARSKGALFWDIDGNEYVDTAIGYGVHFFGHQPDFIVDAVRERLETGYELGPQNRDAGEVAELIHELAGAERVAFCNTGTEAVMVSVRLARAVSGRDKVVRFISSFHGSSDGVLAEADGEESIPTSIGIPQSMVDDTVVLTYGSPEALDRIRALGGDLAAVLVEPVQTRNPSVQPREFLHELRRICTEHGIALIFDEMVVGFRVALGGAQEYFGVESDMSLYGKLVGGGMPIGIVAGKRRYLDAVDGGAWSDVDDTVPAVPTTFFAGTFCKHPLAMASCKAVLTYLRDNGAVELPALNEFTTEFARLANAYFEADDVPLRVVHFASQYRFETVVPRDMSDLAFTLNLFFKLLMHHGIYIWERRTAYFSLAHTTEHRDRILAAIRAAVHDLRAGGFDFRRAGSTAARGEIGLTVTDTDAVSEQEKRVYVLSRMRGGNEAYQILVGLRFDSPPDLERLDAAFAAVAARHEKLRAHYEIDATDIRARVADTVVPERHLFDHTREDVVEVMNRPFDLATAPLWRYGVVVDEDGTHHLVLCLHHIIADGASVDIILNDLAAHLADGALPPVPSTGYAGYVRAQAGAALAPGRDEHRRWWLDQFATLPPALSLPTDSPHPVVNDFGGDHYYFRVDPELHRASAGVIERARTTPFVFHLTLWSVLLAKATGAEDLCVGVPLDQRVSGSFDETVGMFAQSLPLRIRPRAQATVAELLREVRDLSLTAVEHAAYSYDELVGELDLAREYHRNALFDVMFTFTNARGRVHRFGDATAVSEDFGVPHSMLALNFELTERDGGLYGDLTHSSVYDRARMADLVDQYTVLLAAVVADPERTVGDLLQVDPATRDRLLAQGTGPVVEPVPELAELLDAAFAAHTGQPAIRYLGAEITYAELADRVERYAALLQGRGVGRGAVVGLALPPSPELLVLMLAVSRVGAAWHTMDVHDPVRRLRTMIDTAEPVLVVCPAELAEALDLGDRALTPPQSPPPGIPTPVPAEAGDLAYVIFTSGSTGAPKGVTQTRGALANFLVGLPGELGWEQNRAVACLTTPSFDIFLLETLLTLVTGGTVVLADETRVRTPAGIAEFVTQGRVDYLQVTPSRLRLLFADPSAADTALSQLDKLVVGGEGFPQDLLPALGEHPSLGVYNVYGPTETCIWSSVKDLSHGGPVSIGTPIANTTFLVLDDQLRLLPEGTPGNLWIGGHGVSPGYVGRPDLTAERFRDNPFGEGRIYLTGDRALWRDGEAHCLGRVDDQVKIRGYRVELGEIELAITGHDQVAAAAVIVQDAPGGAQVMRGFYRVLDDASVTPEELREWLAGSLTDYMVPATLTEVADIPMTTSGKVDRAALASVAPDAPEPDTQTPSGITADLVAAWRTVLGDVRIGYDDSFFDLGGNSFSLVLLLEELHQLFPGMLDVSDLFANPTISRLRHHLDRRAFTDAQISGIGLRLPADWFTDGGSDGRVSAELPERTRLALRRLSADGAGTPVALTNVTLAVTLGKLLGREDVTLCVVDGPRGAAVVRLNLAGRTDIAQVLDDYRAQLDSVDRVGLDRLAPHRGSGGEVTVACVDTARAGEADLLGHFDLVLGVDLAEPATLTLDHGRDLDPEHAERLLSGHLRLLGALGAHTAPEDPADTEPGRPHVAKEKVQL